jgi:hypothetical protein
MKNKFLLTAVMLILLQFGSQAYAQESKFYALFVTKFVDYVKWPEADAGQKIVIGVWGNSPMKAELIHFAAAKGNIEIIQLSAAADVAKCKLVFLSKEKTADFELLNKSIGSRSILLVTEEDGFAEKGAGISFFLEGSKLKFKLNKSAIESKNIKISTSLMAMATVI